MILAKRLKGKAIATWLGPTGDAARRAVAGLRDKVSKAPRRLDLYFDIADPWSYLAAQTAKYFCALAAWVFAARTCTSTRGISLTCNTRG